MDLRSPYSHPQGGRRAHFSQKRLPAWPKMKWKKFSFINSQTPIFSFVTQRSRRQPVFGAGHIGEYREVEELQLTSQNI
jgi:hypothetical protein